MSDAELHAALLAEVDACLREAPELDIGPELLAIQAHHSRRPITMRPTAANNDTVRPGAPKGRR